MTNSWPAADFIATWSSCNGLNRAAPHEPVLYKFAGSRFWLESSIVAKAPVHDKWTWPGAMCNARPCLASQSRNRRHQY